MHKMKCVKLRKIILIALSIFNVMDFLELIVNLIKIVMKFMVYNAQIGNKPIRLKV